MPNRIIKESICTSEDYARLKLFERDLFVRLIVSVDDFGIFEARPAILKGQLMPLESCTLKQIEDALDHLESVGMVYRYEVNGRPYLQLTAWRRHQNPRATKTKYEMPPEGAAERLRTSANNCKQLHANVSVNVNENVNENDIVNESKKSKHKYGEYQNVLLTDEEYRKLQAEFSDLDSRIEKLSEGIASKGYKYKSHYAAIRSWARRDKEKEAPKGETSFEIDEFADAAIDNAKKLAADLRRRYG